MPKLRRTPQSEDDLIEIWGYIAADDVVAADRWWDRIDATFKRLARNPRLGRTRDELTPGLRSFPIGTYIIFYRIRGRYVEILRVVSGSRDLPPLFES